MEVNAKCHITYDCAVDKAMWKAWAGKKIEGWRAISWTSPCRYSNGAFYGKVYFRCTDLTKFHLMSPEKVAEIEAFLSLMQRRD